MNHKSFKLIFSMFAFFMLVQLPVLCLRAQQVHPEQGRYEHRHANGKIAESGYFSKGLKHRNWYYYNEAGLRVKREKWKAGVLLWQVFYNERGRTIKTIDKNGRVKEFPGCGC